MPAFAPVERPDVAELFEAELVAELEEAVAELLGVPLVCVRTVQVSCHVDAQSTVDEEMDVSVFPIARIVDCEGILGPGA
jgi:hypothetical protein